MNIEEFCGSTWVHMGPLLPPSAGSAESGHFSSDLAELFASAMPSCAKIAQVPESIVQEAEKHLTCVMEAWKSPGNPLDWSRNGVMRSEILMSDEL